MKKLYSAPGTVQSTYVDQIVVRGEELPDHDSSTYLWSLFGPYFEANRESSFPVMGNWLSGNKKLPADVQEKLADMRWGTQKERRRWELSDDVKIFQCQKQGEWKEPLVEVREEVKKRAPKKESYS